MKERCRLCSYLVMRQTDTPGRGGGSAVNLLISGSRDMTYRPARCDVGLTRIEMCMLVELTVATAAFSFDSPRARYIEISWKLSEEEGLKLSTTAMSLRFAS